MAEKTFEPVSQAIQLRSNQTMKAPTLEELRAIFESILASPPPSNLVRDKRTGSIGRAKEDLGIALDENGKPVRRVLVKVAEAKAHHKEGDPVIWRDPVECGQ